MRVPPNQALEPVDPVDPAAPWLGGKRLLASRIIERLRVIPHDGYIEPFAGMGGVFLRRPWRVRTEVLNDASRDVVNLFRILQRHYNALMDMLRWQVTARAEFDRLRVSVPDSLTDLERAVRFLYLQRAAWGGKVTGQNFGVNAGASARFDVGKLAPMLEALHERLAGVVIECLPWAEVMRRYDRPGSLFYLDPPYWGNETDYGVGMFSRADFEHLAEALAGLKGSWLLSLNDVPGVRKCFARFTLDAVQTSYSLAGGKRQGGKVGELLISPRRSGAKATQG